MIAAGFFGLTLKSNAAVFDNRDLASAAAGSANAIVTDTDNLSAALYNSAGLAWQEGRQMMYSNQSRYRNNNVEIGGLTYEGDLLQGTRNTFAFSWLPQGETVGFALSSAAPYVTREDWSAAFPSLGGIKLLSRRYSADIFWRANNTLAIAAGLDIYDTNLSLSSGGSSFSGSDWSKPTAHLGLRWEFMPFWAVGVHMRKGVAARASNGAGDQVELNFPDEITLGLSHSFAGDEVLMALDVRHTKWSSMDNLQVLNNGIASQNIAVNLRDTTDVMLGMTWFWREDTHLRFGYAYEQGGNQLEDYQPMLSDLSGHKYTAGFGGMAAGMHLDVSYTAAFYQNKTAYGAYAGTYSDAKYSLLFSLTKKF